LHICCCANLLFIAHAAVQARRSEVVEVHLEAVWDHLLLCPPVAAIAGLTGHRNRWCSPAAALPFLGLPPAAVCAHGRVSRAFFFGNRRSRAVPTGETGPWGGGLGRGVP
jgi:hypothetical protein